MPSPEIELLYQDHLRGLLLGALLSAFALYFAFSKGFFTYPNPSAQQALPPRFWSKTLFGFAIFLAMGIFIGPVTFVVIYVLLTGIIVVTPYAIGWMNVSSMLGSALGLLIYVLFLDFPIQKCVFGEAFFEKGRRWKDFILGVATWFVAYPVVMVVSHFFGILVLYFTQAPNLEQAIIQRLRELMQFPDVFSMTIFGIVVLAPFIEETLFRGFLQTAFKAFMSTRSAIITSSLIFAIFHFSLAQGFDNIGLLSSLFVLSCFLGFIYERQKSLMAPYALHMTFNAIISTVIGLGEAT